MVRGATLEPLRGAWHNAPVFHDEREWTMTRIVALFATAVLFLGVAVGAMVVLRGNAGDAFAKCRRGSVAGGAAAIGGPFTLTDGSGTRVTDTEVIDGPTLVYFGYSFCPDICPFDLARNALAADLLADEGMSVGQVFVSIDPARDTPQAVGKFVQAIHPDLVGLTGSAADIAEAAGAYRVYYNRSGEDEDFYLMDHSTFTYLVAPQTGFLEFYGSDAPAETVAESVACFAERL